MTARRGSLRSAGLRNVAISAVAAVSTYASLTFVARRFGGSLGSDAYFFLLSLTTILTGAVGSIFATVFLPIFVNTRVQQGDRAAGDFAGTLLLYVLVLTIPVGVASHLFYDQFFTLVSRFKAFEVEALRPVLMPFSIIFVVSVAAEYFRVITLALGQYSSAALGALFQPLTLIAAVAGTKAAGDEETMSIALLVAKILMLFLMLWVVLRRQSFKMPMRLRRHAAIGQFTRISAPYWSANLVTNLATFYFDYVATGLGTGVLTSISYAQRIFSLPIAVILSPILEIARTQFADAQARRDRAQLSLRHNQLLHLVLYFAFPVSALLFFVPHEIIASMFQRGAFGPDNVQIASSCLRVLALSIPFSSVFMLNGRAVESFQRLLWPSVFGTFGNALTIALTFLLVREFGFLGIPYARLGTDVAFFLPLGFIALHRFSGKVDTTGVGRAAGIAATAALWPAAAYFGFGLDRSFAHSFPSIPAVGLVVTAYLALYGLSVAVLDRRISTEIRSALRR